MFTVFPTVPTTLLLIMQLFYIFPVTRVIVRVTCWIEHVLGNFVFFFFTVRDCSDFLFCYFFQGVPGFILKQRRVDFLTAQECEFKTVHKNIDNSCIISALVLLKYSLLQCYMEHISTTHMILSFQSYQQERHVECKQ